MHFKEITLKDKEEIDSIFSQVELRDCDRSFAAAWLGTVCYSLRMRRVKASGCSLQNCSAWVTTRAR